MEPVAKKIRVRNRREPDPGPATGALEARSPDLENGSL